MGDWCVINIDKKEFTKSKKKYEEQCDGEDPGYTIDFDEEKGFKVKDFSFDYDGNIDATFETDNHSVYVHKKLSDEELIEIYKTSKRAMEIRTESIREMIQIAEE